jgi:hypothetical protein
MALAAELGMRPLVAHCHAGLAKLHERIGKNQEAREHFITATKMYREMGMRYWLEKAEREMKVLKTKLRRTRREPEEAEGGGEEGAAAVGHDGRVLFDDLIRAQEQRRWDREAERLRGLEVDDELELCWLLDRQVRCLAPFKILSTYVADR